jgi:5-methylcytosine-specific restriction endonuclease McrBC GTP-binding regulatory subunit McrB
MPFTPEKITKEDIVTAFETIESKNETIKPSTKYDVIFQGKAFPPKEIMRLAHEYATGENLWNHPGGDPTNRYLTKFNFEIKAKNLSDDPLQYLVNDYKKLISEKGLEDEAYKWELLEKYKGRPEMQTSDWLQELKSIKYANLIYGPGIGAMHHLARERPVEYKSCFAVLFNETLPLGERVIKFSSDVFALYRQIEKNEKYAPHHDERTIATILTFHDPTQYSFYKDSFYQKLCKLVNEKAKEKGEKYIHYSEIVNHFIENYIKTDKELINKVNSLKPEKTFDDPNYKILAQDILYRMLDLNARTFTSVIEEVKAVLNDDPESLNLTVLDTTYGKSNKNREWVWLKDEFDIIGTTTAHYEIEYEPKINDEIRVTIHFENADNNKEFKKQIGNTLPENIKWLKWFKADSLIYTIPIKFHSEQTVPDIIKALNYMDSSIGDKVRNIAKTFKKQKMAQETNALPLNQILYGPPGTGKTYHTVNKALQILGEDFETSSRIEVKKRFDKHVEEGRIVFTTFHQSMSYEDFVEGIKPLAPKDENAQIQYDVVPGIFKLFCDRAASLQEVKVQSGDVFKNAKFYKMSLGGLQNPHIHDWCIKNNCVGLGWGGDKNFQSFKSIKTWKDYRDKFVKEFPDLVKESRYNITAMFAFQKMNIGDIVVISKGNHIIDAIGKITGDYFWNDNNDFEYYQFRNVEWLATNLNQQPDTFFNKNISQQSIYEFFDEDVKKDTFVDIFKTQPAAKRPYVMIIDEINRGNISKIFGELITLIEKDKRLGQDEAIHVTLPYSKLKFGVPDNLYIIGTMNTADRSVEALDTALRRRFTFEEMEPRPELLSPENCLYRLLWKYEEFPWEDPEYKSKEDDLFELLNPDEELKNTRFDTWEKMAENGQSVEQIKFFSKFSYTGVNLQRLLTTFNKRIEVLKDRDHQIGHAYFITVNGYTDLMNVFKENIIPLLQEYFFGDYQKIQLVLGVGFIKSVDLKIGFPIEDHDYEEKTVYQIDKEAFLTKENFQAALLQMKY